MIWVCERMQRFDLLDRLILPQLWLIIKEAFDTPMVYLRSVIVLRMYLQCNLHTYVGILFLSSIFYWSRRVSLTYIF